MHIDPMVVLAGLIVGFAVGLTGMGGGALMTPVLVLLLHVQPGAAVSSDLVASFFMKPVAGAVHLRRKTVHMRLAGWLVAGAAPSALLGAALLHLLAHGKAFQTDVELGLGAALLLAVVGIGLRVLTARRSPAAPAADGDGRWPPVKVAATLAVGVLGGLVVGMTSVGSGSLMIVALMFLYPRLSGSELVGTDLVQSVPLVGAAALGQLIFGDVKLGVTASLLIGSLPAVYLGARLSAFAPTSLLRPAIAVMLLLSGLKLVGASNTALLAVVAAGVAGIGAQQLWRRRRGVSVGVGLVRPAPAGTREPLPAGARSD